MGKIRPKSSDFTGGLQTTQDETGLELGQGFVEFQNGRVAQGGVKRRKGSVRLDAASAGTGALSFNGSTQYVEVPIAGVHTLGQEWAVECLCKPTSVTGTQYVVGWRHASDVPFSIYLDGTSVKATARNSSNTTVTLTASGLTVETNDVLAIQLKRDVSDTVTLTVWEDAATTATDTLTGSTMDTPGGALQIGRGNAANYFTGTIDYVRVFDIARPRTDDLFLRWPDSRCEYCVADYWMEATANALVLDRSRYGNTGLAAASPSSVSQLGPQCDPVQAIRPYRDRDNARKVLMVMGGVAMSSEV